jgi:hypothetical protein
MILESQSSECRPAFLARAIFIRRLSTPVGSGTGLVGLERIKRRISDRLKRGWYHVCFFNSDSGR